MKSSIREVDMNELIDEFDDINANSYNGRYPAKKQKKNKEKNESSAGKPKHQYKPAAETEVSAVYPSRPGGQNDAAAEQRAKILPKINNHVLVDFDIQLHVEKKEKQKFSTGTRNTFLKYIATEHADELRAKGFTDKEIKNMKEKAVIATGYSVHHKFPRYFAEAMGVKYNDFNNLILVKEIGEHGDDYIHEYMDSQLREAVTAAKKDRSLKVHDEISFGKHLKAKGKTIKMTIPWPVGSVYLTAEQQKEYERITAGKKDTIDFSPAAVLKRAEDEMKVVSANYADRCEHPDKYPELKNARLSAPAAVRPMTRGAGRE